MTRILFVAPWIPSRIRPRSLGILKMLTESAEVAFVALSSDSEIQSDIQELQLKSTTIIDTSRAKSVLRSVAALPTRRSLQQAYTSEGAFRQSIISSIETWQPDVVHFNVARSSQYISLAAGQKIIVDLDDVRSDYYQDLQSGISGVAGRALGLLEASRMRRVENDVADRAHVVLISSPLDIGRIGPNSLLVRSPHQVVESAPDRAHESSQRPTLLFAGRMGYGPNDIAARWFIREVFSEIEVDFPDARLVVAGERPSRQLRKLGSENVTITGDVPSLAPYYASATLALVPITAATGVQMKLIQALAAGLPTVATSLVLARAGVVPGRHALSADSSQEWRDQVARLLKSDTLRHSLAEAGKAWAVENYGIPAIREALVQAYLHAGIVLDDK